eukprot:4020151-Lingulodinium_polyedra.AAC.1
MRGQARALAWVVVASVWLRLRWFGSGCVGMAVFAWILPRLRGRGLVCMGVVVVAPGVVVNARALGMVARAVPRLWR